MPKKFHTNFFQKLDTDTNVLDNRKGSYMDMENARLVHHDGDGFMVVTLRGMEEKFSLPFRSVPIGSTVYNGVAYIISYNQNTGEAEIGSYPSPDYDTCTGWKKEYQPLNNYTGEIIHTLPDYGTDDCGNEAEKPPVQPFRFDAGLVGWDCTPLQMFARETYDGSVNLYIADGKNPNQVINSGFHHNTGNCLHRYISRMQLENGHSVQFNESCDLPRPLFIAVDGGGYHKAGTYIFFARYNSADQNPTSWVSVSAPVQIAHSTPSGLNAPVNVFGAEGGTVTNKSVKLQWNGLDPNYAFIEVGYVYYHSGTYEARVIDRKYRIQGNTFKYTHILGNEPVSEVDIAVFTSLKPFEKTAHTHTELDNIYYGGNWKGGKRHHPELCEYAKCVVIGESRVKVGNDIPVGIPGTPLKVGQHNAFNNPNDVYIDLGYFSGETYCFMLHPIFNDGQVGLGYPMRGGDNYTGTLVATNEKGIYRFSSAAASPFYDGQYIYSKKATFDFTGCTETDWIGENVCGWLISRAERNANLLYQGLAIQSYNGRSAVVSQNIDQESFFSKEKHVPLIKGSSYYLDYDHAFNQNNRVARVMYGRKTTINTFEGSNHTEPQGGKYGLFSMDYFLDHAQGKSVPSAGYIASIGDTALNSIDHDGQRTNTVYNTNIAMWSQTVFNNLAVATQEARLKNVEGHSYDSNGGFCSRFAPGQIPGNDSFYSYRITSDDRRINMPFGLNAYIGFEVDGTANLDEKITNVYRQDPDEVVVADVYDPLAEGFFIISDIVRPFVTPTREIGRGDCFTQRVYMKAVTAYSDFNDAILDKLDSLVSDENIDDGYGHMVSFVCENKHNPHMRHELGGNRFYPATGFRDSGVFAFSYDQPESNHYNLGYSQVLGPRQLPAHDPSQYYGDEEYKTRIRFTDRQTIQGIEDTYRTSGAAQKEDFALEAGAIVALIADRSRLVSIQERAVNNHPINDRAVTSTDSGATAVLGVSDTLTSYVQTVTDKHGTQHRDGVVKGEAGIYGVDHNKRAVWRLQGLKFDVISHSRTVDTLLHKIIEQRGKESDVTNFLPADHICNEGIHAVHDISNKEVLFTFKMGRGFGHYTLAFSEKLDVFTGRYTFVPVHYISLNEDLFSFNGGSFWLHDCTDERNMFYGSQHDFSIKFAVNPDSQLTKWFSDHIINSNNVKLSRTEWETLHQLADLDWETAPFWYGPQFVENRWKLPVPRSSAVNGDNNIYGVNSEMRGRYMVVELIYNGNSYFWLRDVITGYLISQS